MTSADQLKVQVSQIYASILKSQQSCCGESACSPSMLVYPAEMVGAMPDGVVSYGCGNPIALANLKAGETVLDLGSGAGLDCFLAARQVGTNGSVIGVDFTQEMIGRAEENRLKLGMTNVSFRLGDIEALPLADESVDVVISNCVINLAPDKDAVFREAFRVLRHGGRLMVSDILLTRPASQEEKADMALLSGCISGSLPADQYTQKVQDAGFQDISLEVAQEVKEHQFWFSAAISAIRP